MVTPRSQREGYGQGVVSLQDIEFLTPSDLRKRLLDVFRSPDYVAPVLPDIALRLLELSRRADVEIREVVHLMERDPLIAAQVLKQAQSAYYGRGASIRSLHEAIMRLGLNAVRDLLFGATIGARIFRAPGYDEPMNRLRRHSTATAHVARLVCRQTAIYDEYAFLCGLLHDAGTVASLVALAATRPRGEKVPELSKVWEAVASAHEEAGELLCALWKLPDEVRYVIGSHHKPRGGQPAHPIAAAICVAESITSELGFGIDDDGGGAHRWAADALSLSEAVIASVTAQAKELLPRFE